MKKVLLLVGLILTVQLSTAEAQTVRKANMFSAKYSFSNYAYPYTGLPFNLNDYNKGVELTYLRSLGQFVNIAVPFKMSKASLPVTPKSFSPGHLINSLDGLLQLKYASEDSPFSPYAFGGLGYTFEDLNPGNGTLHFPVGMGLNFGLSQHVFINAQTEYRFTPKGSLRRNLQHGIGLLFILNEATPPPPPDIDGDGIIDSEDKCPIEPGPAMTQGCPDTDGDGIADSEDLCPEVSGPPEFMGCPDTDGDGVVDVHDKCPNEAGPESNEGCPLPDSDGDGVIDAEDACPNTPGMAKFKGCPDTDGDGIQDKDDACPNKAGIAQFSGCPDTDGDGIQDKEDKCPTTAGPASNHGCPEIAKEDKETLEFAIQAVEFETASAKLKSESLPILDKIADIMKRYPDYHLRIGGHTDSVGSAESNQKLSEARAKSCFDYLVSQGISADRMSYQGFGETKPIADNKYKEGRAKNRRVEFELYLPGE